MLLSVTIWIEMSSTDSEKDHKHMNRFFDIVERGLCSAWNNGVDM